MSQEAGQPARDSFTSRPVSDFLSILQMGFLWKGKDGVRSKANAVTEVFNVFKKEENLVANPIPSSPDHKISRHVMLIAC